MKRKITLILFSCLILSMKTSLAQISLLKDYANNYSAPIGTFQGIKFREAGFSGMFPISGTNGTEFWVCSDRGANVDAANANPSSCRPVYDKIYAFPTYIPKIHRVRIVGDSIQILKTITIKRPDGTGASGLLNPVGFGSLSTELICTDTVLDCSRFNLKVWNNKDIWGLDCEAIAVDKNGNFWLSEENGPTIWKLNPNGVVLSRYTPYAKQSGAEAQDIYIDSVFKYRKNNRGFEGLTIAPNGKVYAIIQSPVLYPSKTVGEGTRIHRILEIDPVTNATKMYAYLNDGIIGASGSNQIRLRDWKIGDLAAINDSTFLCIEQAARGTSDIKRLYQININNATVVNSGLYSSLTLEALVDSTGLAAQAIKPVRKKLVMDMLSNSWPAALDKAEGLAILNDSTIAICNDNDYGVTSTPENGIGTATGKVSHILVYRLSGTNKLKNYSTFKTQYNTGTTNEQSTLSPVLIPMWPGVKFTSLLSVKDAAVNGYKMVGIPDGLGAFDNGDGTFTLLMNHELINTQGSNRLHGKNGAFISKWNINKSDLKINKGEDLIKNVNLYNAGTFTQFNAGNPMTVGFSRFCSADLPSVAAFYNSKSGLGTTERIFLNGEESGLEGRAFAHIVTGPNAGNTWELPWLGKFSWENALAAPVEGDKTIVVGTDDGTGGQVYVYVGNKTNTGNEIEKAGLQNGILYGVAVTGLSIESSTSLIAPNTSFSLVNCGNVKDSTGNSLNNRSSVLGITTFLRPEDGAWNPKNNSEFYFATTNAIGSPSRMYKLKFADITKPELGGTISAVLDGTEGQTMMDNLCLDKNGYAMIQEDPGNNAVLAKIWQYNLTTDQMMPIAQFDSSRFKLGGSQYAGFNTQDEESSGIIDMQDILGEGKYLLAAQIHRSVSGEFVEDGQLLLMETPTLKNQKLGATIWSSDAPYLKSLNSSVNFNSLITVGDKVGTYSLVGIPDGMGAFDNGNGTFSLLVNHELSTGLGSTRAHGANGAFVSKWVLNKSDLSFVSGADLIKKIFLWNNSTASFVAYNSAYPSTSAALNRLCSGDLPAVSAYFNAKSGLGTQERIFMSGEEGGTEGRVFAHIATGSNSGTSWELPYLGKFAWENAVASPFAQDKTIVVGLDDGTGGQVYVYVGNKTNSGTEPEKAGLQNGKLYGVAVSGVATENSSAAPADNTAFALTDMGTVHNISGSTLNSNSVTAGVTTFLRPEDGAWDPQNPNDFYFVTTNAFTAPSRLWRLRFTDITKPELGGAITAVLNGTEGPKMMDNLTIDKLGNILIQEDVGNQNHLGLIWQYDIAKDTVFKIAQHDSSRFIVGNENFLTIDEESSGILDMQEILGPGKFLCDVQAHYATGNTETVEGGQLILLNSSIIAAKNPEVNVQGNAVNILNNDMTPSTADNTDYGVVNVGKSVSKNYVIQNTGTGVLNIKNIIFSGINAEDFVISSATVFPLQVAGGQNASITVKFSPKNIGVEKAVLILENNDADETNYSFALQGTAVAPDVQLSGNGIVIANNDNTPSTGDNTDFGYVFLGGKVSKILNIENKGNATLIVNSISISGYHASDFKLMGIIDYPFSVEPGQSFPLTIEFTPTQANLRQAYIEISNNDYDESLYTVALQGLAVPTASVKKAMHNACVVYPNPASNVLSIAFKNSQNCEVSLMDLKGNIICNKSNVNTSHVQFDLEKINAGVYIVQIGSAQGVDRVKVIVSK